MSRSSHQNKEIEAALRHAENNGWAVTETGARAHAKFRVLCPTNNKNCRGGMYCQFSVYGTPKNPEKHARDIRDAVDKCTHRPASD